MLTKSKNLFRAVLVVSSVFAVFAAFPAAAAESDPSSHVTVAAQGAEGSVVYVEVRNATRSSKTVYVVVEATVDGTRVRGATPVSVFAGDTAKTVVGFTDLVEGVESVGIVEDGAPI